MSTPFPVTRSTQPVEQRTGVPEGASSNPARVNSFSGDISSVRMKFSPHVILRHHIIIEESFFPIQSSCPNWLILAAYRQFHHTLQKTALAYQYINSLFPISIVFNKQNILLERSVTNVNATDNCLSLTLHLILRLSPEQFKLPTQNICHMFRAARTVDILADKKFQIRP